MRNDFYFDNQTTGKQEQDIERKKENLSFIRETVIGIIGIILVFVFVIRIVIVSGPSMKQTLINGDVLLLLSSAIYTEPKYGDIVVISKENFKNGDPFIKRVIATEGQEVDINFKTGVVYVDGSPLEESYTNTPTNLYEGVSFPLVVKEGCVFVMGDNRNDSMDSRSTQIGLIDCREILGRAIFILLPAKNEESGKMEFDRIGGLW